ncbi:MAG: hydroxymethylbilane synthase [Candidatus Eisenbacteria bacterium]|uniref:Porphobilinogen deaminase n=1 Tax=Eiseniibacteriota bacterium TaxID=2212470 RepID=A0A538TIN0_UNCEI|nr:MAG: hydroxymethylbilane synthase [Candidatus Eisenbacteria bacterium]
MGPHRVGTRASALARRQTAEVVRLWTALDPDARIEVVEIATAGDQLADAPLERLEGTGFFTSALETALLSGAIDLAVHSYKDLPVAATTGLTVAAVPTRGRVEDALCARDGLTLDGLPSGARVGTSSVRRTAQVRSLRSDLDLMPLRGNVPTRLERVARGDLDAVILATAGLERLGLSTRITEVFSFHRVLTAPAQGALAVQTRAGDRALRAVLGRIEHPPTRRAVTAERAVLHALRGGCSVPVGAFARCVGERVALTAGVFGPDGGRALRVEVEGNDPEATGNDAARRLLAAGAGEILAALKREPRLAGEGSR